MGSSSSIFETIKFEGSQILPDLSHYTLMEMQTWKKNKLLTWRDDSRYFYNEFEYHVKGWNVGFNKLYFQIYDFYLNKLCITRGNLNSPNNNMLFLMQNIMRMFLLMLSLSTEKMEFHYNFFTIVENIFFLWTTIFSKFIIIAIYFFKFWIPIYPWN